MKASRSYYGRIQYPGLKTCYGGTVTVRHEAPDHEVRQALEAHLLTFIPAGFTILDVVPGAIFVAPEGDD